MAEVIGIVVLVVGLLVSIALHEVGHMVPAKKFGVRVSQYFVGFGPTLWSRQAKETEYGIKAIPLGGFVRLVGMVPPEDQVKPVKIRGAIGRLIEDSRATAVEEMHEGEDYRAFYRLAWWKKIIVMAGGPVVNLLLAVILFTVVLSGIGVPSPTLEVREVSACVPATATAACTASDPAAPAQLAGLQPGDVFTAVDGQAMHSWEDLTQYVSARPEQALTVTVLREGVEVDLNLTPAALEREVVSADDPAATPTVQTVGFMGVYPGRELASEPWTSGAEVTAEYTVVMGTVVANLPSHLYHVTRASLGLEERNREGIIGVVGVGRIAAETSGAEGGDGGLTAKISSMLLLLGSLNLALFVFNMIPLVPLDGGHIASALWQAVKNGWARVRGLAKPYPVDVARMMPVAYGVFALLLVMGLVLIYADIVAPVTLT